MRLRRLSYDSLHNCVLLRLHVIIFLENWQNQAKISQKRLRRIEIENAILLDKWVETNLLVDETNLLVDRYKEENMSSKHCDRCHFKK